MIPSLLPTYNRAPLSFVKGEGTWLITEDGQRFLDLGAGIAVNALGHAHPALVAALTAQAGALWHTSNLYRIPAQQKLADALVEATFADTVFFTNSGTEACELAVKMARAAIRMTQPDAAVRDRLRPVYAEDADALIASSQVVATHFATVAAANNYWRVTQ